MNPLEKKEVLLNHYKQLKNTDLPVITAPSIANYRRTGKVRIKYIIEKIRSYPL